MTWNPLAAIYDIQRTVHTLDANVRHLMSQQDEINADVTGLQADLAVLSANFATELAALQAAIANGQPVNLHGLTAVKAQFDQLRRIHRTTGRTPEPCMATPPVVFPATHITAAWGQPHIRPVLPTVR